MTNNTFRPVLITMVCLHFRLIAVMSLIKQTSRACLIPCGQIVCCQNKFIILLYNIPDFSKKYKELYALKGHPEMHSVIYVTCLNKDGGLNPGLNRNTLYVTRRGRLLSGNLFSCLISYPGIAVVWCKILISPFV